MNSSFFSKRAKAPEHGWAIELRNAIEDAENGSSKKQLKVAETAAIMRQWKICKNSAERGLKSCSKNKEKTNNKKKKKLTELKAMANKELAIESTVDSPSFAQDLLPNIRKHMTNVSFVKSCAPQAQFTNLTLLQSAACIGDVRLVESMVALGAAVDIPVKSDSPHTHEPHFPAPNGSTALVLGVARLSMHKIMEASELAHVVQSSPKTTEELLQCAVILVMLGADFNKRLEFSPVSLSMKMSILVTSMSSFLAQYDAFGLRGKSVKEMAVEIGDELLLEAIRSMEESPMENAWCRCGSRLPWKECHAAPSVAGQHKHFHDNAGEILYRYSPLAPCPCTLSNITQFDCCGWLAHSPTYLDDVTGAMCVPYTLSLETEAGRLAVCGVMADQYMRRSEESFVEHKAGIVETLRRMQPSTLADLARQFHPKCPIGSWDTKVYAGIVERQEDLFLWNGIFWNADKLELEQRAKEWNEALDAYCDDMGLSGEERDQIVRKHTAIPCAPCGNLACDNWEVTVKEFNRCAKCKAIAYCSRDCQKSHWKQHKRDCMP
ncbi:hypothetical protein MPSEU_000177200 [Mayamaea pseudoterrestris]|nr:hypothetical protein MPSEU_000177200 [Mayamaea pseudoterrestris]